MKTIKLWGGIADGVDVEVSKEFHERRAPLVWQSPPPFRELGIHSSVLGATVWADVVGGRDVYDHHEIRGQWSHPCVKGLVMRCRWDFWSRDIKMGPWVVERITHGQRPDHAEVVVTLNCPFLR